MASVHRTDDGRTEGFDGWIHELCHFYLKVQTDGNTSPADLHLSFVTTQFECEAQKIRKIDDDDDDGAAQMLRRSDLLV